eukprot:1966805-Amphidinium_carterae.1
MCRNAWLSKENVRLSRGENLGEEQGDCNKGQKGARPRGRGEALESLQQAIRLSHDALGQDAQR